MNFDSNTTATSTKKNPPSSAEVSHWNAIWANKQPRLLDVKAILSTQDPLRKAFYASIGEVKNLNVLDLGCGDGELSVLLALLGANVTALDTSEQAINSTRELALANGVGEKMTYHAGEFSTLRPAAPFDLLTGVFVLHHIEPFDQFCRELKLAIRPGGRGVFIENNGRNPLLMLARKYLTGRFGIPRYGDNSEYPFEPRELDLLRTTLGQADYLIPQLIFFRKLNTYIFRHKPIFKPLMKLNDFFDLAAYQLLPFMRKYSYQQIILFSRSLTPP